MRVHHRIVVDEGHLFAVFGDETFERLRRARRTAEFERLRGVEKLDGQHPFGVAHHAVEFGRGVGPHAHMVLLPLRRGDRIDRRGHAEPLRLADDRGRRVLGNHEAAVQPRLGDEEGRQLARTGDQFVGAAFGDAAQLRERDGQKIHRQRDGLTVEIARRDDHILFGEDRRIVGGAVDFGRQHALHIVDRIFRCPVHLRDAAEGVGILHMFLRTGDQLAAFEQTADVAGRGELALVRADQMHLVAEGFDAAVESVERQRADAVGPLAQAARPDQRPDAVCAHELGAVQQGQPLLGFEPDRLPAPLGQHLGGRPDTAFALHFAQSQQRQAHMRQRRQVARSAERPLLVDHGQYVVVEKVDQPLHGRQLHAGMAVGERLYLEQKDQFHDLGGDALPRPAGVRHDEVLLQLGQLVVPYRNVAQRSETGGDAVNRAFGVFHLAVEVFAAADDACAGIVAQGQRQTAEEDFADAVDRKMLRGDKMMFHVR